MDTSMSDGSPQKQGTASESRATFGRGEFGELN